MALKQQNTNKGNSVETQGPVNEDGGWGATALPTNPSDEIFQGRALPLRLPEEMTVSRPFSIPTKPPLHFNEGLDGAAEVVTSRTVKGENAGAPAGEDKNKYSGNPNDAYTSNGVIIYGS